MDTTHGRLKATQKKMQVRGAEGSDVLGHRARQRRSAAVVVKVPAWAYGRGRWPQELIRKSGSNKQLVVIIFLIVVLVVLLILAFM